MKIQQTTNYTIFKHHEKNRIPDEKDLKRLEASIKSRNMLEFRPILVNKKMEVIDGNHRLEVAKRLEIPVFYQIDDAAKDEDMIIFNQANVVWKLKDYLNFYVSSGNKNYIKLKEFCERNGISINIALKFIGGENSTKSKKFRSGEFVFEDAYINELNEALALAKECKNYLISKRIKKDYFLSGNLFTKALLEFFLNKSVDFSTFMHKLPYKMDILKPCTTASEFVKLFQVIYNHNNRNPIDILQEWQREKTT